MVMAVMALMLLIIPVVITHELEANTTFQITTSEPINCPEEAVDNYVNLVVIFTFLNLMSWILSTVLCTIIYFKYIRKKSVTESSLSSAERGNEDIQENHLNMECPFVEQSNENICCLQDNESNSSKTLVKMLDGTSEMKKNILSKSDIHLINGNCKLTYVKVDELLSQGNELGLPLVTTFIPENPTCETIVNSVLDANFNFNSLMKNNCSLIHTVEVDTHNNNKITHTHNVPQQETINRFENVPLCTCLETDSLPENGTSTLTKVENCTEILKHKLSTIDEESELQFVKNFEDSSISSSSQTLVEIENEKIILHKNECLAGLCVVKIDALEQTLIKENNQDMGDDVEKIG